MLASFTLVVYLTTAASPPPARPLGPRLGLTAFLAGQTLDLATTLAALHRPGVHEANALYGSHPSPARLVLTTAAVAVPVSLLLHRLAPTHPKLATWLGVGLGGVSLTAAASNLRVIAAHPPRVP